MRDPKIETEVERLKAKALARWEGEGGALGSATSRPQRDQRAGNAKAAAENRAKTTNA